MNAMVINTSYKSQLNTPSVYSQFYQLNCIVMHIRSLLNCVCISKHINKCQSYKYCNTFPKTIRTIPSTQVSKVVLKLLVFVCQKTCYKTCYVWQLWFLYSRGQMLIGFVSCYHYNCQFQFCQLDRVIKIELKCVSSDSVDHSKGTLCDYACLICANNSNTQQQHPRSFSVCCTYVGGGASCTHTFSTSSITCLKYCDIAIAFLKCV